MSSLQYSAGVCNIGEAEINQRKRVGYFGLSLSLIFLIIYTLLLTFIDLNPYFGFLIVIPSLIMNIGFLQARRKFCAAYGLVHKQNVSSTLGLTLTIEDKVSRRADRNKALGIIFQSIAIAVLISLVTVSLGFILFPL